MVKRYTVYKLPSYSEDYPQVVISATLDNGEILMFDSYMREDVFRDRNAARAQVEAEVSQMLEGAVSG